MRKRSVSKSMLTFVPARMARPLRATFFGGKFAEIQAPWTGKSSWSRERFPSAARAESKRKAALTNSNVPETSRAAFGREKQKLSIFVKLINESRTKVVSCQGRLSSRLVRLWTLSQREKFNLQKGAFTADANSSAHSGCEANVLVNFPPRLPIIL